MFFFFLNVDSEMVSGRAIVVMMKSKGFVRNWAPKDVDLFQDPGNIFG